MSLPGRLLTSWVLDTDGAGGTGLEIMIVRRDVLADRESSGVTEGKVEVIKLSGIVSRNELFNRLLSLGEQRSEVR